MGSGPPAHRDLRPGGLKRNRNSHSRFDFEFLKTNKITEPSDIILDGFVKSSNSRRANFVIMRRTFRTLNDYEMQHNAEVGLFTKPSIFTDMFNDLTEFGENKGLAG